ncbi:MAG: hypothetical protein HY827_04105 [Actinobacteria bacterium]|nr:hypothetical protein [Actinomycetota bacterium]
MTASTDTIEAWVRAQSEGSPTTLSVRYLGEEGSMLNADQIVDVVNALWRDFCEAQGEVHLAAAEGWSYVSGGMAKAVLVRGGIQLGVERFCGGWLLNDERTVKLLAQMKEATAAA